MRLKWLLLLAFFPHLLSAQITTLQGIVFQEEKRPLEGAHVLLVTNSDSVSHHQTTTWASGVFIFHHLIPGQYHLLIQYMGYTAVRKEIRIRQGTPIILLDTLYLDPSTIELQPITVTAPRPLVIKGDTLEFNTTFFKTKNYGTVQDLLELLPGLYAGPNGQLNMQGEPITKILIDGKEFFGGDIQVATQNLPASSIRTVQVIDQISEEGKFSGIGTGHQTKVVNLTLKEAWKNSYFGEAKSGFGTASRYAAEANVHQFNPENQFSLIGKSHNINQLNGSGNEPGEAGQAGRTEYHQAGANFESQFNKKWSARGSYLFTANQMNLSESLSRQNFQADGFSSFEEDNLSQRGNNQHNASTGIQYRDSVRVFKITNTINSGRGVRRQTSSRQSINEQGMVINRGQGENVVNHFNQHVSSDIFYGQQLRKEGRKFSARGQWSGLKQRTDGIAQSSLSFQGDFDKSLIQNSQLNRSHNFAFHATFTEPVGDHQMIQLTADHSQKRSYISSESSVQNQHSPSEMKIDSLNLNTVFWFQQVGLAYQIKMNRLKLEVGVTYQFSEQSRFLEKDLDRFGQQFSNILPKVDLEYKLPQAIQLKVSYQTFMREPDLNQLQPLLSVIDPLHLLEGNPKLRPELQHQTRFSMNHYSVRSGLYLSGNIQYNKVTNPIVASVDMNDQLVRTTRFINLDNKSNILLMTSLGKPLAKIQSQINISPYLRRGFHPNLINGVEGGIRQQTMGGNLVYIFRQEEFLQVNLKADINRNLARFQNQAQNDQVFTNSGFSAELSIEPLQKYDMVAQYNFRNEHNPAYNFRQSMSILNLSFSRALLKNERGEMKFLIFNALNQKTTGLQEVTANYSEQSRQSGLGRFFMLSFHFRFHQES